MACLQAAFWREPAALAAAQPGAFLLPVLAVGLQVPRALWNSNHMWYTGTSWSAVFGAAQAMAVAAATGRPLMAACIAALVFAGYWALLASHAAAARLPAGRHALSNIVDTYRAQAQPFTELVQLMQRKPAA